MSKKFSLSELAEITKADLIGNPRIAISNVDTLESASEEDASFFSNILYIGALKRSNAGVICIDRNTCPVEGKNFLVSDNPSYTFQLIVKKVLETHHRPHSSFLGRIHPTAIIHPSATIHKDVTIAPYVVIDAHVCIGPHTQIYSSVFIGPNVKIGEGCILHANSVVQERCVLGDRVILQPGAIIGSCGFGYDTNPQTGEHTKLDQMGTVVIENDVEIGANSTIDRARFKTTYIKQGTKIDNLVQVGHNVEIGENVLLVAQSGISGSTKLGNNVVVAGQAGIVGHINICDNVTIAAKAGVTKTIKKSGIYGGFPVSPIVEYRKRHALLRKLEHFSKEIQELKNQVAQLHQKHSVTS